MSIMNDTVFMPSVLTCTVLSFESPFCAMYIIMMAKFSTLVIIQIWTQSPWASVYFPGHAGRHGLHLAPALSPRCLEFLVSLVGDLIRGLPLSDVAHPRMSRYWTGSPAGHGWQALCSNLLFSEACHHIQPTASHWHWSWSDIAGNLSLHPMPVLLKCHLTFYRTQLIFYAYCEYIALVGITLQMLISSMVSLKLLLLVTLTLF